MKSEFLEVDASALNVLLHEHFTELRMDPVAVVALQDSSNSIPCRI